MPQLRPGGVIAASAVVEGEEQIVVFAEVRALHEREAPALAEAIRKALAQAPGVACHAAVFLHERAVHRYAFLLEP